jgi:hypothetical protein
MLTSLIDLAGTFLVFLVQGFAGTSKRTDWRLISQHKVRCAIRAVNGRVPNIGTEWSTGIGEVSRGHLRFVPSIGIVGDREIDVMHLRLIDSQQHKDRRPYRAALYLKNAAAITRRVRPLMDDIERGSRAAGGLAGDTGMMRSNSTLSLASRNSFLSIGSTGSFLSVGSIGSFASIGSVGSAFSVLSIGSFMGLVTLLSSLSMISLMSHRARRAIMGSKNRRQARLPS